MPTLPSVARLEVQIAWLLVGLGLIGLVISQIDRDGIRYIRSAYQDAIARVEEHPEVIAALGGPIEARWWRDLDIAIDGRERRFQMHVAIEGSRSDGELTIRAHRRRHSRATPWQLDRLSVRPRGGGPPIEIVAISSSRE